MRKRWPKESSLVSQVATSTVEAADGHLGQAGMAFDVQLDTDVESREAALTPRTPGRALGLRRPEGSRFAAKHSICGESLELRRIRRVAANELTCGEASQLRQMSLSCGVLFQLR
jgi:hypothetical protein